jgi:hypothetical protein
MNHTDIQKREHNNVVIAPGLGLIFPRSYVPKLEPGWVSPQYGEKISAPVVSVHASAVETTFFTLVMPLKLNEPLPVFRVLADDADCEGRISFEVAGVGRNKSAIDRITWGARAEHFAIGSATGTARAAWVRAFTSESASVAQACGVSTLGCLPDCATELLPGAGPLAWIAWDESFGLTHSGGPRR